MGFNTLNDYVESLDENGRKAVSDFISFMESEFPNIKPRISFSMPMWWAGVKMYEGYVAISPAKKHYSIHFHDESYLEKLKKLLTDCSFGKRCINIRYGDEQAISVVKNNVREYLNGLL